MKKTTILAMLLIIVAVISVQSAEAQPVEVSPNIGIEVQTQINTGVAICVLSQASCDVSAFQTQFGIIGQNIIKYIY